MLIRKIVLGFFLVGLLPILIQACDFPVYPVKVNIKVKPQEIRADIKTNFLYWKLKILGKSCTMPDNWPENTVEKAKDYIDSHFQIFLDGQLLKGKMTDYGYIETPLVGHKGANLFFRIEYSFLTGHTLTVRSRFFSEYHEHIHSHHEFATHIKISGRVKQKIILPIQNPEHSFYFPDVLVTAGQTRLESLKLGLTHLTKEFSLFLVFILVVMLYFLRQHIPKMETVVFFIILSAGFLFGMYCPLLLSDKLLSLWKLLGLITLSTILYFQSADFWWLSVLFISIPPYGITAAKKLYDSAPPQEYFLSANIFFFIGWVLTIIVSLFVIYMFLIVDRKYILRKSKSMADRIFLQHRKFIIIFVGIISIYFLFQLIKGGLTV